jgi:hypothetical protein
LRLSAAPDPDADVTAAWHDDAMLTSRRLSYLIGAATLWMPLYLFGFITFSVALVVTQPELVGGDNPPPAFLVLLVLHLFTMLLASR